ncbi:AraC family transcriptional regulator [Cohnella endophytica]|uniref:AraC family transcriptional regulator n=1 Tax=Cohnella endophytica TaxID=2419778 RepID=A0A494Y392_9BACL|nr:helix-turn-helix transcriptional regulator [Cohnella endophytica]RKP57206.1 AraC family transcriptional regulator [Cohnella endophytica]
MLRRTVYPTPAESLPLQLETIGLNPEQEPIQRPDGYPLFHWLQTIEGEGELNVQGKLHKLPERSGVLLHPNVEHSYSAKSSNWKTYYVTFTGTQAVRFVIELLGAPSDKIQWDRDDDEITIQLECILQLAESGSDPSGWKSSAELYRFLTLLKTNGRKNHLPSISRRLERIQQLLEWLETQYANPEVGLAMMAERLHIGERQLNERFRELFGQTAYAYLIQLRLRKAKEWLPARPDWTVRRIGEAVGFRDASHFVATFRQKEGMTPEQYRRLHGPSLG